jgi:RNA methyltransferase, TrmH family
VIDEIFVAGESSPELARAAVDVGVRVTRVTEHVLASICDTTTPQGIVATVRLDAQDVNELAPRADLLVLLADVRDPGNAGTLVRSAAASGANGIIFARGSVDPWHPKTVRASAGALFHIAVVRGIALEEAIDACRANQLWVIAANARADRPYHEVDLTRRTTLVLGNEAWGLPPEKSKLVDESVGIPMELPMESLNVGVAGSIILFEAARQRRLSSAAK